MSGDSGLPAPGRRAEGAPIGDVTAPLSSEVKHSEGQFDESRLASIIARLQDWDHSLSRLRRLCALLESEGEQARGELWALAASTDSLANSVRADLALLSTEQEKSFMRPGQAGAVLRLHKVRRDVERLSRAHANVMELIQDLESEVSEWGMDTQPELEVVDPQIPAVARSEYQHQTVVPSGRAATQTTPKRTSPATPPDRAEPYGTFETDQRRSAAQTVQVAAESEEAQLQARYDAQYAVHDMQERQTLLQRIQNSVQQAHAIFLELASMTEAQQQPLDDIEARTQRVRCEQESTAEEWARFARRRRTRRRFCFWFSIWMTLVLLFTIYVLFH
jgi:t-SNARE complex subunit (syntaxin)